MKLSSAFLRKPVVFQSRRRAPASSQRARVHVCFILSLSLFGLFSLNKAALSQFLSFQAFPPNIPSSEGSWRRRRSSARAFLCLVWTNGPGRGCVCSGRAALTIGRGQGGEGPAGSLILEANFPVALPAFPSRADGQQETEGLPNSNSCLKPR